MASVRTEKDDSSSGDLPLSINNPNRSEKEDNSSGDLPLSSDNPTLDADHTFEPDRANDSYFDHDAPPDGGSAAWLQVAGAFFLFFNSWGLINAFGVFQSYYEENLLSSSTASAISWVGTIQGFLLFLMCVFVGPLFDKGLLKSLLAVGTFCVVFGLMMASLSTEYYQIFLSHGVLVGIGCAFIFLPSMANIATYFTSKRAVAIGIVASGGSIGSVIYSVMFHRLISSIGFGWTARSIGFVALGTQGFAIAVMKQRSSAKRPPRSLIDPTALKELEFILFSLGMFLSFIGLYMPIFYLPTYFTSFLHDNGSLSAYVIAILNAASFFGRIGPGLLADRVGSLNTLIPLTFVAAILSAAWVGIRNVAGTVVFAVLYGFASGAIVALPPGIVASLSPDMGIVATRMGMCFVCGGFGLLIGSPIAGSLLKLDQHEFWRAQVFASVMTAAGASCFLCLRLIMVRRGKRSRV